MVLLDATIVNVALLRIQRTLGFSGSGLEWVVNAYALAFGGLMLPCCLSRAETHSQPLTWHFALVTLLCDIR